MAWATPQYTKTQVDGAGGKLTESVTGWTQEEWEIYDRSLLIINNWRSSHSFPLNTFQVGLRERGRQVDRDCIVAQRIKRLSSIELKLRRFKTMKLSQMQDIGGCRAVVQNVPKVLSLVSLYERSGIKHKLDHVDDYIRKPRSSGYRGIHLVYRYYSDRKSTYNGLTIEMQIRTPLQHAWATAVETVGTFTRQALKSSQGEEAWLRFFALMGTAIAMRERTAVVPDTPTNRRTLTTELRHFARALDVEQRLRTYGEALRTSDLPMAKDAHYYLLELDAGQHQVTVIGFKSNELEEASNRYLEVERNIKGKDAADAVLVSVDSLDALRRAYPNYFLDTAVFIRALRSALS